MSRKKKPLSDRVFRVAETALAAQGYVSGIDVLVGISWLSASAVESWRRGQIESLEDAIPIDPARVSQAMALLRSWAEEKRLLPSPTDYIARTPQRQALRFSLSGDPSIETAYRTHWLSQELSGRQLERLAEKASRAPELVVIVPLNDEWKCHRCSGAGGWLMMENPGPACLDCVGLGDLEYLPAGDALLTRRVKARSGRSAVVVRFSRTRRRYERQGLLVEPSVLAEVQRDLELQRRVDDATPRHRG